MWNHAKKSIEGSKLSDSVFLHWDVRSSVLKTPKKKLEKLKRKLLKFWKGYDLCRVVPGDSWRPEDSENVVVFEFWRFQTIVIGRQSQVKIEEKIPRRGTVTKKRHGHNFEFWAPKLNQRGTNMVGHTLIQFQAVIFKIVAVSFFVTAHSFRDAFTFSAMCWLWAVITGVKITVGLITYTFSESSGR